MSVNEFESLILQLETFFEGRAVPKHKQLGAALGFAAYLIAASPNKEVMSEHAVESFVEMLER